MFIILAQQNREVTTLRKPPIKRSEDEALIKQFNLFYEEKWEENLFYLPSDFIKEFDINRHLARYYLMNMVYEKKLFRVKYYNKTSQVPAKSHEPEDYSPYTTNGLGLSS